MSQTLKHSDSKPKAACKNATFFKPTIQKKMRVGSHDDAYEIEADTMANKVMRMSESSNQNFTQSGALVHEKCSHCDQEEKLQKKSLAQKITPLIQRSSSESAGDAPIHVENQINKTKGGGSLMDTRTRNFMETRFGADFSEVRIHTGSQAVQMSWDLNAQAFTVGSDVYFNEEKYSPNSNSGKHLLAHELTHTLQQRGGIERKVQRTEICPPRPSSERATSARPEGILPINIIVDSDSIIIQDFAVNSSSIPQNVTNSMDWQRTMSNIAGNPSIRLALQGHTDCVGSDAENIALREQRVSRVMSLFSPVVRSKVVLSFTTAEDYLATNLTGTGRAQNRSVRIIFRAMEDRIQACDQLPRATNIDQLVFLTRCVEQRLGLIGGSNARTVISALRQIYYGNADWSASRNRVWDSVITTRPWNSSENPSTRLGPALNTAIRNSQTVEGIDFGHLLTGIDAMLAPQLVDIDMGRLIWGTSLRNEEWATWAGDVGSAAGEWALASLYAQRGQPVEDHFSNEMNSSARTAKGLARSDDLLGNIDSFSIRLALNNITNPVAGIGTVITINRPLSDIIQEYYRITGSTLGRRKSSRISNFITAYGGVISSTTITNKSILINRMKPSVAEFASLYYLHKLLDKGYFGDDQAPLGAAGYLTLGVDLMTITYINWLERNIGR